MIPNSVSMANLDDLASLSKVINKKSDEINPILENVDRQLRALRIGVEAWLDADPLTSSRYQDWVSESNPIDKKDYLNETHLGYARHGTGFALVVKEVRHVKTVDRFGQDEWEVQDEGAPQLLLEASRTLRVKALAKLEALFDVIKKEAELTIESIDKGKKAVEALKPNYPDLMGKALDSAFRETPQESEPKTEK